MALLRTYNIHINHRDTYIFTLRDHGLMREKGLTPGIVVDEIKYLHDFLVEFPDVFIGRYCMREAAYGRSVEFPSNSVSVTLLI